MKILKVPFKNREIEGLKAGDEVLLSGVIYTARDQAHQRLVSLIQASKKLPINLAGAIIYYCGPTATPKGKVIGSCGPTTSRRMDEFVESLLRGGLAGMIGKGRRSKDVRQLIKKYRAVYFLAPAGCGALLARHVVKNELVVFGDLGPEAIYRLEVKDFPVIVGIDSAGKSVYEDL
jgi:fumarate hydratase subunit beta